MERRLLTEDEVRDARAMVGGWFWAAPAIWGLPGVVGLAIGAIGGNPAMMFASLVVLTVAAILCLFCVRDFKKVNHDIEMRIAEVIEGAPEKVWTSHGYCYLLLAGRAIRVPPDVHVYASLREANVVRVAFLPTALTAVNVEPDRGLGIGI